MKLCLGNVSPIDTYKHSVVLKDLPKDSLELIMPDSVYVELTDSHSVLQIRIEHQPRKEEIDNQREK